MKNKSLNILTALIVLITLSSCGIFRNVNKDKTVNKEKVSIEVDKTTQDKSYTKETTILEGTATSPERGTSAKASIKDLQDGKIISASDSSGLLGITLQLNELGEVLATTLKKKEIIPVDNAGTRVKETFNDIETKEKTKEKISTISKQTIVEKVVSNRYFLTILLSLGIGLIVYIIIRKVKI